MIPLSRNLMSSFLTTSFILGLSLHCISLEGLAFSSKLILCAQIKGLIPFMSTMVPPNVFL
jgi:hypothetical protein